MSENDPLYDVVLLLKNSRKLVKFFKKSKKYSVLLDTSLKSESIVRWDTTYLSLKSILDNEIKLKDIDEEKVRNRVNKINFSLIKELVKLLEKFFKLRVILCSENSTTINLVYPNYLELKNHLKSVNSDSYVIKICH